MSDFKIKKLLSNRTNTYCKLIITNNINRQINEKQFDNYFELKYFIEVKKITTSPNNPK